jgi:mannose-6-phosphate isomerase-like protein (cupin superfamily)
MIRPATNGPLRRQGTLILIVLAVMILVGVVYAAYLLITPRFIQPKDIPMSYKSNIIKDTQDNENFRRVLFTGKNSQLVVMSIPPGGDVGAETHKYTEQTLFFLSGTGEGELNGDKFPIVSGDVVVVVPGTEHNFWNTGAEPLKIYTVYAPPNHLDGLVEATKAEADANTADEAVGETPPTK